jgi:hypothetical protein
LVETPREFANLRAKELARLLARLRAGEEMTELDADAAASRAQEARRYSVAAHIGAAERFLQAAELHDRAAEMYEALASSRTNVGAQLRALDNRDAAERKRSAAVAEIRRAMEAVRRDPS